MIIYTKNETYKIWANTEDCKFYIQLGDDEVGTLGYDTAAEAINEAESLNVC
jgi:hypothetical protein